MLTTAVPDLTIVCGYTVRRTQYDRLSQQQLSFLLPSHITPGLFTCSFVCLSICLSVSQEYSKRIYVFMYVYIFILFMLFIRLLYEFLRKGLEARNNQLFFRDLISGVIWNSIRNVFSRC